MRQKAFGKLYAEFRIEYAASRQHIRLQLFPGVDLQLSLDLCLVLLYGGCRHLHVGGNFIGRPAPHHQHCHRKLCRSQVVRHLVAGVRIVDVPPPLGEMIGDVDDALEVIRPRGLSG